MVLATIAAAYQYALAPVAPFTWLGLKTSTVDLVAIVRLCVALRQMREGLRREYDVRARCSVSTVDGEKDGVVTLVEGPAPVEERSFVRDALATLLVVYGGEAMICSSFSCSLNVLLRFRRSLHLCSSLVHVLRSDTPPLRPYPGRRRSSPHLVHSNTHIYLRAPASLPGRIHTCDLALHPYPARRPEQPRSRARRIPLGAPLRLICKSPYTFASQPRL